MGGWVSIPPGRRVSDNGMLSESGIVSTAVDGVISIPDRLAPHAGATAQCFGVQWGQSSPPGRDDSQRTGASLGVPKTWEIPSDS